MVFVFNRWTALAIYLATGSILVFAHGFSEAGPRFTAIFITGSTLALLLLGHWADFTFESYDLLFGVFLCGVAASFAVNGPSPGSKENVLLALSLSGYPAARLFAARKAPGVAPSFFFFTAAIVVIGALATGIALISQWTSHHGKPFVFGEFDAAPAQFTTSLGFLAIALICARLTSQQTLTVSVFLTVPAAIFAASVVRLAFVALAVALGASLLMIRTSKERIAVATVICAILVGVIAGNVTRANTTIKFARYALVMNPLVHARSAAATPAASASSQPHPGGTQAAPASTPESTQAAPASTPESTQAAPDSSCMNIDMDNSVAIRRELYAEALALIPKAGLFGMGLDRFMGASCISRTEIHNTILQAIVEFGWIGGTALIVLLIAALVSLWPLASQNAEARFALCGLIFASSLAMGGGRISRDSLVFLFLGYAAGMKNQSARSTTGF